MPTLSDQGYEIHVREQDILIVDRKLWGPGFALFGLTMIAGLLLVLGILGIADLVDLRSSVSEYGLFLGAIVLAVPIPFLVRGLIERRRLPLDEVPSVLVIDLESNALTNRMGEILAQLENVRAAMHIDWMTRGLGRLVVLRWPSGRRVVFRSFQRKRALQVLEILSKACGETAELGGSQDLRARLG